jgi:large subunit ribosomal protein L10
MVRPEKIAAVEDLTARLRESQGLVLADFTGLTVASITDFRRRCREKGVEFRVVKNRLARRAAAEAECSVLDDLLKGPTGIAFGLESPIEPAKVLVDFAKDNEKLVIKGGYLDGKLLSVSEVEALSKVPGREELLAMLMSAMQGPARGLVSCMSGVMRNLVGVMDAYAKKKAEAA